MSGYNNRNRRAHDQPRGYVASLSPQGQVNKVIHDMNNFSYGDNLRAWSASARKELTPALTVALQVGDKPNSEVRVPKQALLVASPVVRDYFVKKPTAITAKFTHADVSLNAIREIAKWLKDVCLQPDFPELPVPDDIGDALKLRLTAYTLGMERYTGHFDACYIDGVEDHVPDLIEIAQVVDNTRKKDDPVLVALANRLSYLMRYHKVSSEEEVAYAMLFKSDKKYKRLLEAVVEEGVQAMVAREHEDM